MTPRTYARAASFLSLISSAIICHGREEEGCTSGSCPASLLQKVFRSEEKGAVVQEQPTVQEDPEASICTGTRAQSRCWYLSDLGESCAATCSRYGQNFSYVVASESDPVTPRLVGHIPKMKQEPWAALECYAPTEDRYHTANGNAAKHVEDLKEIGSWSHENCKLACPCTGSSVIDTKQCRWVQPPACAAQFIYKGMKYSGCATVDSEHNKPWCQHHEQHMEPGPGAPQDWSYCDYNCAAEEEPVISEEEGCEWKPAYSCAAEFDYEGVHYKGCTATDHEKPWCSNTNPYQGSWSSCIYSCAGSKDTIDEDLIPKLPTDNAEDCYWQPRTDCPRSFEYKGIEYVGCTEKDHPVPWCSHDRVHKGSWTTCTKICNNTSVPISTPAPTPAPTSNDTASNTTDLPAEEAPCTRHPESENDVIGMSVTLDEAGYKVAAAADSPINMKRFICRVVGTLDCYVNDLPSLMAFVPYYSGMVSQQTYKKLVSELTTLCHTGGKWVSPLPELARQDVDNVES